MALLSNINDKFAVDSTGAIQFNGQVGTSGYVLKSNANAAPTWVDPSTVIGGPYLPLTGGTLTGNLAISGSNSLTVGGLTTLDDVNVTDTLAFYVSSTDAARQRADARDDDTNYSRLHWFGKNDTAGTSNFRHAYYDGAAYINVTAASGAVTFDGILAATGGTSTEWNTSYDNSITALSVTGTTTKTLTATQQDGGTLTASWTDDNDNTSWPNVGAGIRTNYTLGFKPPVNGYSGFYFQTETGTGAGYFLIRGGGASGAYTDQGISLIADAGWLSLVSRTTTDKGVRIMAGATATTRLTVTSAGHTTITGIFGAPSSSGSASEGILRLSQSSGVGSMYMGFGDPYSWIQSRSSSDYSVNYALALNPNGGNVGIGTTSPTESKLVISGGATGTVGGGDAGITMINKFDNPDNSWSILPRITGIANTGLCIRDNTDSADRLVIDGSGNVGIGTASPGTKLDVYQGDIRRSGITSGGYIEIGSLPGYAANAYQSLTSGGSLHFANNGKYCAYLEGNDTYFGVLNSLAQTKVFFATGSQNSYLAGSGNFGIGTTSPATKLHLKDSTTNSAVQIAFENDSRQWRFGVNGNYADDSINLYDLQANTTPFIVKGGTGNVGIGTDSPETNAKLDVRAGSGGKIVLGTYDANYKVVVEAGDQLNFYNGTSAATAYMNYGFTGTPGNILLSRNLFVEANSSGGISGTVRIKSDGKVLINSSSNGALNEKLFVNGTVRQQSSVGLNANGTVRSGLAAYDNTTGYSAGIGGQLVLGYIYTGSSYTEGALIKMYKQNSTQGHYGSGLRWAVRENGTNLTAKMDLSPSGTLTVIQDIVAYGSPSDKKLKQNIKPISSALDKITKLQGVTFDWKESDSMLDIKEDIGFIAQDVQKVIPELVRKNSNGLLSMRHQGVIPMLVEAIKELEARVKELENK